LPKTAACSFQDESEANPLTLLVADSAGEKDCEGEDASEYEVDEVDMASELDGESMAMGGRVE
jgi:hypothetical protein